MFSSMKLLLGSGETLIPYFVSYSGTQSAVAGNTVVAPASITDGDLLVGLAFNENNARTVTPPAGFAQDYFDNSANNAFGVYSKIASSESGNYTFTWDSADESTCIVMVYRDANNVNTVGTIARTTSDTHVASSITPTKQGTLLAVYAINDNDIAISTPPSGMTERAHVNTAGAGSLPETYVYDLDNQNASATGTKTAVWGASKLGMAILLQIANE